MARVIRLLSVGLLAISAVAFAAAFYIGSDWNWRPVTLPLPGPGLSVDDSFEITTSGKFRFEASVPISVAGDGLHLPDLPAVPCNLEAQIGRQGTTKHVVQILRFEYDGRAATESYSSEPSIELRRGRYELRLFNRGTAQPFGQSGAIITLTRFVHPTEAYLQGVFLRGIGWFALVAGVLLVLIAEWAEALRRRASIGRRSDSVG